MQFDVFADEFDAAHFAVTPGLARQQLLGRAALNPKSATFELPDLDTRIAHGDSINGERTIDEQADKCDADADFVGRHHKCIAVIA